MHKYGWLPDIPDQRDHLLVNFAKKLPVSVDLRPKCPPVYDQEQLGSCTANAVAAALDFERAKQGENTITPSRLFIYYNERKDQGTISSDSGATIRESAKAVKNYGACPESEWPYVISKFTDNPGAKAYSDALNYEDLAYKRVSRTVGAMKTCLAAGQPFLAGITVYDSFESAEAAKTGVIPMPSKSEGVLGGHAILIVGYQNGTWIFRNSWGDGWGAKGYGYLPEAYLTNTKLSSDFWTLTKVK